MTDCPRTCTQRLAMAITDVPFALALQKQAEIANAFTRTAERRFGSFELRRSGDRGGLEGSVPLAPCHLVLYHSVTGGCDKGVITREREGATMHSEAFTSRTRRQSRGRRTMAVIAALGALGAVSTTTSASVPDTAAPADTAARNAATFTYILPGDEVFAEGVAVAGDTYYVTGFFGIIFRGDLDEREAEVFIPDPGCCASGIEVVGDRLLVAGAWGGHVSLYDRTTGALLARWSVANPDVCTNVNDIAIAANGDAYITDSLRPALYRIPAAEIRHPSAAAQDLPIFLDWEGTPFTQYACGFLNANGIVATPDGRFLLVVNSTDGRLFRVRLSDKQVTEVSLGGYRLISGDGMVLTEDNILYVVSPATPLVAKLRLNPQYNRGRLLSETTDPSFHSPTTAAIARDRLLVVNSQFSGPPSAPPWTVSSIPLP